MRDSSGQKIAGTIRAPEMNARALWQENHAAGTLQAVRRVLKRERASATYESGAGMAELADAVDSKYYC